MGTPLRQPANVIDFVSRRNHFRAQQRVIRLAPELDGLEMIYRLASDDEALYGMPVLAWALKENGEPIGMVPWMDKLTPCQQLDDPEYGRFVGYRDPETNELFDTPPDYKIQELQQASLYYDYEACDEVTQIQQIPDTQGTHALCMDEEGAPWLLKQVHGWRLFSDGSIDALLVDEDLVEDTPILLNDNCIYSANTRHGALYYFQRNIANRIKQQDAETLEALAMMVNEAP